jgi:hypothetical protein
MIYFKNRLKNLQKVVEVERVPKKFARPVQIIRNLFTESENRVMYEQ